jgi:acetylornithine deacetylase/succinyl-diaminopimelate desuccinylase-like protein
MNIGGNILVGRTWQDNKGLKVVDKVANNIIPRGFLIESDIRIVPGQDPLDIINIITSNIDERIKTIKPTVSNESFDLKVKHRKSYPMETAKESSIVMAIEDIMNCPAITAAFNTEGSIFNDIGSETVIWGPSDINQAHKDNEYVLAELFKDETVEKYIRLIKRMCI